MIKKTISVLVFSISASVVFLNTAGSHADDQIYSVLEVYDDRRSLSGSILTVRGRWNTHPDSEPKNLITLRDLRDPLGITKNISKRREKWEEKNEMDFKFFVIGISPLEAFYGTLEVPKVYKVEEMLESIAGNLESECVIIKGYLKQRNKGGILFASLVPVSINKC